MSALDRPSARDQLRVADREHWQEGPPHALFEDLRSQCPVHFTDGFTDYPSEAGFWSVTTADDVREVSRDWQTYSSASGITAAGDVVMPVELIQAMFIGMDPPKHDRIKALFQRGFTPKRIAEHEDEIRAITTRVLDGLEGARPATSCRTSPSRWSRGSSGRSWASRPRTTRSGRG
jgi:cholest-4-en-3-one 26-monooxygenase